MIGDMMELPNSGYFGSQTTAIWGNPPRCQVSRCQQQGRCCV